MVERLVLLTLVPILSGMLLQHQAPRIVARYAPQLRAFSILLLLALLAAILLPQRGNLSILVGDAIVLGTAFTIFAMLSGWGVGHLLKMAPGEKMVLPFEYAIHNLGIAAIISATCLGRPEFLTFVALFVVLQFGLITLGLLLCRVFLAKDNISQS